MNNQTILVKIRQRANKLSSNDFDNIADWAIIEAFDKGMVAWCRRNLHGLNVKQTGDEQSKARIDDFQVILNDEPIVLVKRDGFYEGPLPANYFQWKRIAAKATSECCSKPKSMVITLAEEANVDEINRDFLKKPSFEWGETYCTLIDGTLRIHTNNEFDVEQGLLFYYRQPRRIEIVGVVNPYTGLVSTTTIESEFKDDIIELFVDEAAKILAGDIESFSVQQTATQQVETNN